MKEQKIDLWAVANSDKLTPEQMKEVRSKVKQAQAAITADLKSP